MEMTPAVPKRRRDRLLAGSILAGLLLMPGLHALAQEAPAARGDLPTADDALDEGPMTLEQAAPLPDSEDDSEPIEPESIEALKKMGEAIAAMKTFELKATSSVEVVLDDEQKLLIEGSADYQARRPDGLRVDMTTDVVRREFIYDGKTVTIVSPGDGFYGKFDAPPTIKEMLEKAADDFDLALPLADLFDWGTPDAPIDEILRGFKVGESFIAGKKTNHYAFREEDQDWEIWIAEEGAPLPLKYSIVDRLDPSAPRFSATLDWTSRESFPTATFEYDPPAGASQIGFMKPEIMP